MRRRSFALAMALALTSTTIRAQESMTVESLSRVKDATVFVRTSVDSEPDGPAMSGSGFVVHTDEMTCYVVTNHHVVTAPLDDPDFKGPTTTTVYFRSGTKQEAHAVAEIVARQPRRDLALLKVTNVPKLPRPIELNGGAEPFETMTVYVFGFPFGEQLTMGKGNPPVNVGRGQVSSLRRNPDDRLTSILLDGALNPGNSGGHAAAAIRFINRRGGRVIFLKTRHVDLDRRAKMDERSRRVLPWQPTRWGLDQHARPPAVKPIP